MKKKSANFLILIIIGVFCLQAAGCGTILYPERRGQTTGEIDPGVAILDAILFIPGIIPGVIAFAVDLTTGAIFRPSKKTSAYDLEVNDKLLAVEFGPKTIKNKNIQKILNSQTGKSVALIDCKLFKTKNSNSNKDVLKSLNFHENI